MAGQGRNRVSGFLGAGARAYRATPGRSGLAWAAAELAGLCAIVVAQPVFDALQRSAYAFAAAGVRGFEVVLLAVALVALPPAAMLAIEALGGLVSRSLRGWIHLFWIALLVSLLGWQAVKQAGASVHLLYLAVPAAGFIGAALLYLRSAAARTLLRFLALAAPAVVLLFLFTAPIKSFTLPGEPNLPGPGIRSQTPVVVVVFDELPLAGLLDQRQRVDAARFPHFAALAKGSNWYRKATTVADTTVEAVPAILTGDFPRYGKLPTYSDHPRNIFTLFGSSGPTNISESATSMCPRALCPQRGSLWSRLTYLNEVGFETADSLPFDLGTRAARKLESGRPGAIVPGEPDEQVARFLSGFESPDGGSLNFLHVQLPHIPYQYLPSGKRYQTSEYPLGIFGEKWPEDPGYAIQGLQRMLLQLRYADKVLGEVVGRMRRAGIYRRALLAVVADHGGAFIPGQGRRLITRTNAGWIAPVPLFVKLPGQVGGRAVSRPARTVDLLPTIADAIGIQMPWPVDGRSLLRPGGERRANTYTSGWDDVAHVPARTVEREFFSALAVRNGLFGRGSLFTMGAGRRQLESQLRGARRVRYALQEPAGGISYDPGSGSYPSLAYGRLLDPPAGLPDRLIATLDGRPVAVAEVVAGGTGFTTMIPPSALRPGANRLALFAPR
ncbi:MAG: sulfatase-like hydrolase/transferase [Solirubrobacterales bacterium]